jgi:predicted amidophosphoribosyltransferase
MIWTLILTAGLVLWRPQLVSTEAHCYGCGSDVKSGGPLCIHCAGRA